MRTEEDLRAALTAREDLAPDPTQVLSAVRRRGRRATGVTIAATATIAVAASVVVAVPLTAAWRTPAGPEGTGPAATVSTSADASPPAPPSGRRPPFAFTLQPVTVAGFTIEPMAVNTDVQIATAQPASGSAQPATLYVYDPGGQRDPASKQDGQLSKVVVNGAPAWVSSGATASTLSWEYAPDAWAVITSDPGPVLSQQTLVALAQGVRYTAARQVKMPYRLGFLPAGFVPFNVVQRAGAVSVVQLETPDGDQTMDITVHDGPRAAGPERPAGWQPTGTIAGRPAVCTVLVDGRRCAVDLGEFTVDVGGGALETATVERIVAGMSFATWRDPSTWYDLDRALPSR
jgi:hypothetical protein